MRNTPARLIDQINRYSDLINALEDVGITLDTVVQRSLLIKSSGPVSKPSPAWCEYHADFETDGLNVWITITKFGELSIRLDTKGYHRRQHYLYQPEHWTGKENATSIVQHLRLVLTVEPL
jgi:hypothetical protein